MANNRKIDSILYAAEWEIDLPFGIQHLNQYLVDLDRIQAGIPYSELNYSQSREDSKPVISSLNNVISTRNLSSSEIPPNSIAIVKIQGVMRTDDGLSSQGSRSIAQNITDADKNTNIVATVIKVNSGGGEAMAGTLIQKAIEESRTPVYAVIEFAGSAALKAMLPANKIYSIADESKVGSIGSYKTINKKLVALISETFDDVYADQSKLKNVEFREYIKGNLGPLLEDVNKDNSFFLSQVQNYRPLKGPKKLQEETLQGKLLNSNEALEVGLIDGIKSFESVLSMVQAKHSKEESRTNFNKSNFYQMTFQDFRTKMISVLNAAFGISLNDDSKPEEIIDTLEKLPSLDERIQAAIDEKVKAALPAAQITAKEDEGDASKLDLILQKIDQQEALLISLNGENKKLKGELATAKGKQIESADGPGTGKTNSDQPKYLTVEQAMKGFELPGKAQF